MREPGLGRGRWGDGLGVPEGVGARRRGRRARGSRRPGSRAPPGRRGGRCSTSMARARASGKRCSETSTLPRYPMAAGILRIALQGEPEGGIRREVRGQVAGRPGELDLGDAEPVRAHEVVGVRLGAGAPEGDVGADALEIERVVGGRGGGAVVGRGAVGRAEGDRARIEVVDGRASGSAAAGRAGAGSGRAVRVVTTWLAMTRSTIAPTIASARVGSGRFGRSAAVCIGGVLGGSGPAGSEGVGVGLGRGRSGGPTPTWIRRASVRAGQVREGCRTPRRWRRRHRSSRSRSSRARTRR